MNWADCYWKQIVAGHLSVGCRTDKRGYFNTMVTIDWMLRALSKIVRAEKMLRQDRGRRLARVNE